ncbi:hypothetical protein [Sphingomonas sp. S2M10]|uniref:hypothetical protein n=1 Tax=Sphingomonas sp. S2M10 TaxID=2705010 RepID=UPI0014577597|nr:hypothetical protein [Sphingomonas sp. S2M10]
MQTITESELSQDMDGAIHRVVSDGAIARLIRAQGESVLLIPASVLDAVMTGLDSAAAAAECGPIS